MNEMVERVAKAIAICNGHHWEHYCDEASAAIAAMREPTPEMIEAMRKGFNHTFADDLVAMWQRACAAARK